MALSRRFTQRATDNIWPGFVDAMTALLLVLMFVLTIFMVIQSVLSERILDQDTELDELTLQLSDLADALGMERQRTEELTGEVGQLTATLDEARSDAAAQQALIATLTATVSTQRAEIASQGAEIASQTARLTDFEDQVAALLSRTGELESQAAQLGDTLAASEEDRAALQATLAETESARDQALSEAEALNLALAKLRTEVDAEAENARLAAARAEAFESLFVAINLLLSIFCLPSSPTTNLTSQIVVYVLMVVANWARTPRTNGRSSSRGRSGPMAVPSSRSSAAFAMPRWTRTCRMKTSRLRRPSSTRPSRWPR